MDFWYESWSFGIYFSIGAPGTFGMEYWALVTYFRVGARLLVRKCGLNERQGLSMEYWALGTNFGFWNTASFWYGVVDPEEFKNFWQGVQEDKIECVREIWEPLTRARFKGG